MDAAVLAAYGWPSVSRSTLQIEVLSLPAYSPNLHRIERVWKLAILSSIQSFSRHTTPTSPIEIWARITAPPLLGAIHEKVFVQSKRITVIECGGKV